MYYSVRLHNIGTLAATFPQHGIEANHLRMQLVVTTAARSQFEHKKV